MPRPTYFLREGSILLRRRDGAPDGLPDEVLWPDGWEPIVGQLAVSPHLAPAGRGGLGGSVDPAIMLDLERISHAEARAIAASKGRPLTGW